MIALAVITALVAWLGIGLYGLLMNVERILREWGERSQGDWMQHLCTLILGPFGIALVVATGGRIKFWTRAATLPSYSYTYRVVNTMTSPPLITKPEPVIDRAAI